MIKLRAYIIALKAGFQRDPIAYWLEAEQHVDADLAQTRKSQEQAATPTDQVGDAPASAAPRPLTAQDVGPDAPRRKLFQRLENLTAIFPSLGKGCTGCAGAEVGWAAF
jgi:hypothetical protein